MQDDARQPYNYLDAGYNRFFKRGINSDTSTRSLSSMSQGFSSSRNLNFDQLQVSGSLGDTLRVGRVFINGTEGRISTENEAGDEVLRLGNLE